MWQNKFNRKADLVKFSTWRRMGDMYTEWTFVHITIHSILIRSLTGRSDAEYLTWFDAPRTTTSLISLQDRIRSDTYVQSENSTSFFYPQPGLVSERDMVERHMVNLGTIYEHGIPHEVHVRRKLEKYKNEKSTGDSVSSALSHTGTCIWSCFRMDRDGLKSSQTLLPIFSLPGVQFLYLLIFFRLFK